MRNLLKSSIFAFILVFVLECAGIGAAEPKTAPEKKPAPAPASALNNFSYSAESRRDPFEPVNLIKAKRSRESTLIKDKKGVAEDAGYELEELKLVGILRTEKRRLAMMEDMQGKGIIFKKDDYLNKNLWVVDVQDTRVVFGYKLKGEVRNINVDIPKK
ncbi:MAG TPA: pilus assembly protein PilP [Syntrophorhabdaceae bacterium]|nr:pilus assembly protein PilP [Syntrophorhabdaceae bacterium]HQM80374.1 pilus assembly protein PilP [Syntrophorhabdaceae bacterium]